MNIEKSNSISCAVLFVYDCARFALILALFRDKAFFVSANALFPIMRVFLLFDNKKYAVYTPLYSAGKALSVLLGLSFFLIALKTQGLTGIFLKGPLFEPDIFAFFMMCSVITDALAMLMGFSLKAETTEDSQAIL